MTTSLRLWPREQLDRRKFLLWISAAEFPRLFVNASAVSHCLLLCSLLLTRWHVACTKLLRRHSAAANRIRGAASATANHGAASAGALSLAARRLHLTQISSTTVSTFKPSSEVAAQRRRDTRRSRDACRKRDARRDARRGSAQLLAKLIPFKILLRKPFYRVTVGTVTLSNDCVKNCSVG